jgi:hypothetical protein
MLLDPIKIRIHNDFVNIDSCYSVRDAFLDHFGRETIGAM